MLAFKVIKKVGSLPDTPRDPSQLRFRCLRKSRAQNRNHESRNTLDFSHFSHKTIQLFLVRSSGSD